MAKVTVIMPIYKAEKFLSRSVRSLMEQTLDDIEYIFINDCSPDASKVVLANILADYPNRLQSVITIENEKNMGTAFVRTQGLKAAHGEYIGWCDADDWCEIEMFEKMYNAAKRNNYDIVTCNYTIDSENDSKEVSRRPLNDPHRHICELYKQPYCLSEALWDKIVKRTLIEEHSIYPFEGIDRGEDFNMFIRTFYYAKSCKVLDNFFYHYWMNPSSMTKVSTVWEKEKANFDQILFFLERQGNLKKTCDYIKFTVKHHFKQCFSSEKEWFYTYKECHKSILSFSATPLKTRIAEYCIYSSYFIYKLYTKRWQIS